MSADHFLFSMLLCCFTTTLTSDDNTSLIASQFLGQDRSNYQDSLTSLQHEFWKNPRPSKHGFPHLPTDEEIARKHGCEISYSRALVRNADWSYAVCYLNNLSFEEACQQARSNSTIAFFFYVSEPMMTVEMGQEKVVFFHGDAVFFSRYPFWDDEKDDIEPAELQCPIFVKVKG